MHDHDLLFLGTGGPASAVSLSALFPVDAFETRSKTVSRFEEAVCPFLRPIGKIQR